MNGVACCLIQSRLNDVTCLNGKGQDESMNGVASCLIQSRINGATCLNGAGQDDV